MSARRRIKKRILRAAQPPAEARAKKAREPRRRWPRVVTDALPDLWSGHSAETVARILTRDYAFACTRNAVIGKIHRLRASGTLDIKRKPRL